MDINDFTALELSAAIKNKLLTCTEAVNCVFQRISNTDRIMNSYITICKENTLIKAAEVQKRIDSGELKSPIAGVPVALKDNICTENIETTCASRMLKGFIPPYSATVVKKLESAGAIIIGKLNMDEFAMGSTTETSFFGAVKNPYDTSRTAGGSSGGCAAAVAAGQAFLTLGSDTGGSIRQPAAHCGVTGFKPTYGTVSRYGLVAYASSMDQIGPIGKSVSDCAAAFDVIKGKDKLDGTSLNLKSESSLQQLNADVKGVKVALPREFFNKSVDPEIRRAVLSAAEKFKEMGTVIEEIDFPSVDYMIPAYYIIASAEASSNLARFDGVKYGYRSSFGNLSELYRRTRSEGFGKEVKKRILLGTFVLSAGYYDAYYNKALKVKALINQSLDRIFDKFDIILSPCTASTAPKLGESLKDPLKMYLSDVFTVSANLAGLPSLSVPCGFADNGMPIGMQLTGRRLCDNTVLNLGFAYQQATDFHKKRPEVV